MAAHTSKPVVYEELANAAGISVPTAKKWVSILVSSHIIALVQPYYNNALKRVVKMLLLHFLDTGLAAYLLKWSSPEVLEKGASPGKTAIKNFEVLKPVQEPEKFGGMSELKAEILTVKRSRYEPRTGKRHILPCRSAEYTEGRKTCGNYRRK